MWSDAAPNLLIGLREGLEAGLIVSIVLATVVRTGRRDRLTEVWAGVLCAAGLSLAFGAVLTFAAADLSTAAQETIGGVLSLVAVGFVTWMVFWMRRSARTMSANLRSRTEAALAVGGGVLFVTAFLAVAREGLETALFLWSTTRTTSESTGPLFGAVVGLITATVLCWALYRQALRINLTRFFTWTGGALVVIAAGVAGYGVRELQGAKVVAGTDTAAFDLTARVDPSSWYARIVEGVFNVTPQMTVGQVAVYLLYLVPVLGLFVVMAVRGTRAPPRPAPAATATADAPRAVRARPRRVWPALNALGVGAAALVAVSLVAVLGPKPTGQTSVITVTDGACATGWSAPTSGQRFFEIHNTASQPIEIYLMDANGQAADGEIEGLAPGTSRTLAVALAPGSYLWRCVAPDGHDTLSATEEVTGAAVAGVTAYVPVSVAELDAAKQSYRSRVADMLGTLAADTDQLLAAVRSGGASSEAKALWLQAHLDYIRIGAAYGTFGDFDPKINGRPNGLPGGVSDPGFTGFLRLERELWQAPPGEDPAATAEQLDADIHGLLAAFPQQDTDPRDLPLRAHEILENGLQFELTGETDQGSHTNVATLRADVDATHIVLSTLTAPLSSRNPQLLAHANQALDQLAAMLDGCQQPDGSWTPLTALTYTQRRTIDGAVSQLVEDLAPIPDILELPPGSTP